MSDIYLFILIFVSSAVTAITAYAYLHSSFKLLELVKKDPLLWRSLNEPRRVWFESVDDCTGDYTIKPLKPWLRWVWSGHPHSMELKIMKQWRMTSLLLKMLAALSAATLAIIATLIFSILR